MIRGIGASSALLFNYIVTRYLPPDQAGYLFLSMSIVFVMTPVGMLGLGRVLVRFISVYHGNHRIGEISQVVRHSHIIAFIGLTCSTLLTYTFAGDLSREVFEKPELEPILRTLSPSIFFVGFCYLFAYQFQALRLTRKSIFTMSIGTPLAASAIFYLWDGADAQSGAYAYTCASMATLATAVFWWALFLRKSRSIQAVQPGKDKYQYRDLLRSSLPLWAVAVFSQWSIWGIHIIAGASIDPGELAQLNIAQRVANLISFILIAVNFVIAPRFAQLHFSDKHSELADLVRQAAVLLLCWSVPAVVLISILSPQIMSIFGNEYRSGAVLLVILCMGQLVNALAGPANSLLVMSGHEKDVRNTVCAAGIIAIGLALFLIQLWGAMGAAAAIAMTMTAQNLVLAYIVKLRLGINMFRLRESGQAV